MGVVARRRGRRPRCVGAAGRRVGAPVGLSRRSRRLHSVAFSLRREAEGELLRRLRDRRRALQLVPQLLRVGKRGRRRRERARRRRERPRRRPHSEAVPRQTHAAPTHPAPQTVALERVLPRLLELLLEADGDQPVRERRAEGVAGASAGALDEGRRAEALETRPRRDQGLARPLGGGVQVLGGERGRRD